MTAMQQQTKLLRAIAAAGCGILVLGCIGSNPLSDFDPHDVSEVLERGDTASAIALLEKGTRRRAAGPEVYVSLARLHRSRGTVLDRLASERVLEKGLREHPDHPDLLVELGRTCYEQSFYGEAARLFRRALRVDPHRCEAHAYLGADAFRKWKNAQTETGYLSTAVEHLKRAADCPAEERDALFILAFSRYVLGDTARAMAACDSLRTRHPDAPEPLFLAGAIAFERAQWDTCRDLFGEALSLLSEEERTSYMDISLLLDSDEERKRYSEATLEEKWRLQRLYWLEHDPDPTTEINPRLLEHIYRTFLAEVRFAQRKPPLRGWQTERGTALIKFGKPAHVRNTLQGSRPWDGRTEIWTYPGSGRPFALRFRDEYLNGNYIVPLDDVVSARELREEKPVSLVGGTSVSIPGAIDVVAFRESDVSCAVYVSFSIEEDSLLNHLWTWRVESFSARTAFFDDGGEPRGYFFKKIPADSVLSRRRGAGVPRHFIDRYELPFDAYRIAHTFEDERALARSVAWSATNTSRYAASSLAVSDLVLCALPVDDEGSFLERRGRRLRPAPRSRLHEFQKLGLYLEIYNLALSDGAANYEVAYSIYPLPARTGRWQKLSRLFARPLGSGPPEPAVSQSFERTGASAVAAEEVVVDIGSLEPGEYEVHVSVTDAISGRRASTSKNFVKIARSATP